MYKKQLYRVALISSPIMAMFELTPAFFLREETLSTFLRGTVFLSFIAFVTWCVNIYIVEIFEAKKSFEDWKRYFLSYLFALLIVAFFMLIFKISHLAIHEKSFPERHERSVIFPFINAIALNTIILIISNSIIIRSKKIEAEQELAILRIKNLEAEQQQLIQQLQPHFLFNALSTLKSLIKVDAALAEEYLLKLSDFLRFTISANASTLIPLEAELKFTRDYIKLQQIRFTDSFFCDINIPEAKVQECLIPVYALQTLVENAIKHNAFTYEHPLRLSIAFWNDCLVIKNNRIPKPFSNDGGVGLENLNKRYSLIGGENIQVEETPDTFTVIIKLIPKT